MFLGHSYKMPLDNGYRLDSNTRQIIVINTDELTSSYVVADVTYEGNTDLRFNIKYDSGYIYIYSSTSDEKQFNGYDTVEGIPLIYDYLIFY